MRNKMVILFDIYGELLSESQREVLSLRYNSDLSLAEIAEEMGGISRQAVNGTRVKAEARLIELEEALGCAERFAYITGKIEEAEAIIGDSDDRRSLALRRILYDIKREL